MEASITHGPPGAEGSPHWLSEPNARETLPTRNTCVRSAAVAETLGRRAGFLSAVLPSTVLGSASAPQSTTISVRKPRAQVSRAH